MKPSVAEASSPSSPCCVVELTQRVVPSFVPPQPFSGLLAHLMAKQASFWNSTCLLFYLKERGGLSIE